MKANIKESIKNNKATQAMGLLLKSYVKKIDGNGSYYPKVLQLPITYKCNSKCVMCNIWKMDYSNEMNLNEFSRCLKDPIFKKVESVGINGGEPSLIRKLPAYAEIVCRLPSLRSLNIISHGFNDYKIKNDLKEIFQICKAHGKKFHISISLDGVGEIHNIARGKDVFRKTFSMILEISKNQSKYCDSFDIGCTIIKQNVDYLVELDSFLKVNNLSNKIKYRLGIDNKRIESDKIRGQYSVIFTDSSYSSENQSAKEFLMGRMSLSSTIRDKFKYFALFYWLVRDSPKRLLGCMWQEEGVTMDSRGKLYYCAVASDELGDLRNGDSGEDVFFSKKNIQHRKEIVNYKCNLCIHDYVGKTNIKNVLIFFRYMFNKSIAMYIYKFKGFFL